MKSMIELQDVSIAFGPEVIYDKLSFSVIDGEFLCILGPSGCGKSTLLRVIGDLLKIDTGRVDVNGQPASDGWVDIAYVFQSPRLMPWRNALENVMLGQELRFGRSITKSSMQEKARSLLQLVGLGKDMQKMPAMLSGGERQRVSIARALAVDPKIILMDEPFSALDVKTRKRMRTEIVDIWKKTRKTVVFVTHEIDEALELADRIVVLSNKPTSVNAVISIDDIRPRDMSSANMNSIREKLRSLIGIDELESEH